MLLSIRFIAAFLFVILLVITSVIGSITIHNAVLEHSIKPTLFEQARVFSNAIHHNLYTKLPELEEKEIKKLQALSIEYNEDEMNLHSQQHQQLKDILGYSAVVKLNIYSKNQKRTFSYPANPINLIETIDYIDEMQDAYYTGLSQTSLISNAKFVNASRERVDGTLFRVIIPVKSINGDIYGVNEFFYDVSALMPNISKNQLIITGLIFTVSVVLYSILLIVSWKSDKNIERQQSVNIELNLAKQRAERLSFEKSKFLANISHELRTPLNAIIGFSDIMKNEVMGAIDNPQYKDYVFDINNSSIHLLSLINDILDFSKAEAGKLEIEKARMDINKVIKSCVRIMTPRAEEANITLTQDLIKEHIALEADQRRVKQVLLNLLSNAIKFTPEGGKVIISLSIIQDLFIKISVQDTGIGISAKNISRAMSAFGQVDNELSRKYDGTGLGLPFSKKLVEMMHGIFEIKSAEGVGTTVTIRFPINPSERKTPTH